MKPKSKELIQISGESAYKLYWMQAYKCKPRLSTIKAIDLNLDIIVDENHQLLAFRHDLPEDMKAMILNVGHWKIWNEEKISPEMLQEIQILMGRLRREVCWN